MIDPALKDECVSAAETLEALAKKFRAIGWDGHAGLIQSTASHLLIYSHQIDARKQEQEASK